MLDGRALTDRGLNVRSIAGVAGDQVVITAWTEPSEIHLFLVDTTGERETERLTSNPGVHSAVIGRPTPPQNDGGSEASPPTILTVVTSARPAADGVEVAVRPLDLIDRENEDRTIRRGFGNPLAFIEDVSHRPPIKAVPTYCQLGADRLESALFLPSSYDGERALPVLLDPYGGPTPNGC